MKSILIIAMIICSFSFKRGYSQYKLKDIAYNLSDINKRDDKGRQGIWVFYDKIDSTLFAMQHFVDDTLHGYFERYWQNGKVSEMGFYKKGIVDSTFIAYWQNGKTRGEAFYVNGLLNGVITSYNQDGKVKTRLRYVHGIIDSTYELSFIDSSIVWDNQAKDKIDTLVTNFKTNWNKRYDIYTNDTLSKVLDFYKDVIVIESYYQRAVLSKRIVYYLKQPHSIEKIFYYNNGELIKSEFYDKKGKLFNSVSK